MLAFSLSRCRFQKKIELRKLFNLNSRLRWGAKYPRCTEHAHYFLISNCVIQVIFWTEDNLCFISGFRNSFNCKLKKLINEQIIIFYSSSNAPGSSDESVQKNHLCIIHSLVCVPFPLGSICKYQISVNEDTTSLIQIERMWKCVPS